MKSLNKNKQVYSVSLYHITQLTRHHPERSDVFLFFFFFSLSAHGTSIMFIASEPHCSTVIWIDLHLNTNKRGGGRKPFLLKLLSCLLWALAVPTLKPEEETTFIFLPPFSGYMKRYCGKLYKLQFTSIGVFYVHKPSETNRINMVKYRGELHRAQISLMYFINRKTSL